ncbi:ribbon-helix-helix domain-containing protein [Candidatus Bathyarchaeota archaeon]|nr:ribbon-helix-helix domain-containing protein [Candidatus Bathyarchaeota archaeon]
MADEEEGLIKVMITVPKELLDDFDRAIRGRYNRSEAIRQSMRRTILELNEKAVNKTIRDLLSGKLSIDELKRREAAKAGEPTLAELEQAKKDMLEGKDLLSGFNKGVAEGKRIVEQAKREGIEIPESGFHRESDDDWHPPEMKKKEAKKT